MRSNDPKRLARKILDALAAADEAYEAMTGGWRLHDAPEYFATVHIARRIAKYLKRYATLEQNINDAVRWSDGKRLDGNEGSLPPQGRFDIAVWGPGDEGIHGPIEVKVGTGFTYSSVSQDVERGCDALREAPALRWGMVAFYFVCWTGKDKSGRARVQDRTTAIVRHAREHAEGEGMSCCEFVGDMMRVDRGGGRARAAVLLFQRNG